MFAKNTLFSKNVNSINGVIVDAGGKYKALVDMYTKLSLYVRTIRILIKEYADGNFVEVAHAMTQDAYNKYSIELAGLSADAGKYGDYENLRLGITDSLQGLYQSILQHNILLDTEAKLSVANKNLEILYDPIKLQDWIDKMKQKRTLFGESNVKATVKATVKPEYAEYIKLYGYPPGGNFDMNKLAGILVKLNINSG
jgi:hypothetical protein